jgi:hypothetical protein
MLVFYDLILFKRVGPHLVVIADLTYYVSILYYPLNFPGSLYNLQRRGIGVNTQISGIFNKQ